MAVVQKLGLCLNLKLNAPSQYVNFTFDSMAVFLGVPIAANDNGIYELETQSQDAGTNIRSYVVTAKTDFGVPNQKRIRFLHFGSETTGNLLARVTPDDGKQKSFPVYISKTGYKEHVDKISVGRDQKGSFFSLQVENLTGSDFSVDRVEADIVVLNRGHR